MKLDNKGTTLVEVMAGFMLLVVLMTSFVKIIDLASRLSSAAVDAKKSVVNFQEKFYEGENYPAGKKNAFRDKDTRRVNLEIKINEIKKDELGNITNENAKSFNILNYSLVKIENIYDTELSKTCVYRYTDKDTDITTGE